MEVVTPVVDALQLRRVGDRKSFFLCLRVEVGLKIDSGYPKDTGVTEFLSSNVFRRGVLM